MKQTTNLDAALEYASRGLSVFPCGRDKKPLTESGFKNASKDPKQITRWWNENPDASIGMPTGPINGLWVLDIDMPEGPKSLSDIERKNGAIPSTLSQRTGGGGAQYFWKWNGHNIRNSASQIGKNIDVRGDGGYVILPPSGHPSGNNYTWVKKTNAVEAPEWLADLASEKKDTKQPEIRKATALTSKYGQAALLDEIRILRMAEEGSRNDQLNKAAFALGQLISGGELDEMEAVLMLTTAAQTLGLDAKEIPATMRSGMESGKRYQRTAPRENNYHFDMGDDESGNQSNHIQHKSTDSTGDNQDVIKTPILESTVITESIENDEKHNYNLHQLIGEWIRNSTGCFTVDQLDREFCLKTRTEKVNRSKSLCVWAKKNIIKKDINTKGKWHVIDSSNVQWVDLHQAKDTPFSINLPFGLHNDIVIPQKSIIVLAGSSNAGKTTFLLNTLKLNMSQEYTRMYLMSEMGAGQYKRRISRFNDSLSYWQENVRAAERSHDFDAMIQNHNPNGLTCIDFLEEVDGEYFKIPTSIRNIYDSLGTGCAFIAIQKKSQSQYGKGGEATREKACLYITLDLLTILEVENERSIFCAIKLDKVKESAKSNMEGKELHFRIDDGVRMTVVSDWAYASKVNRARCIELYERGEGIIREYKPYIFKTKEGDEVTLSRQDYESWRLAYPRYDLDRELKRISEFSSTAPWLTKKGWFWQLGNHLDKQAGGKK